MRVLVIDDSATVRACIELVLEQDRAFSIAGVAGDVPTARGLIDELAPDLITLDLNLPGIDGMAFLDELANTRHAPILVLSSSTTDGSDRSREAISRGALACFDKTKILLEAPRFRRLIQRTAERHRRRAERGLLPVVRAA